MKSCWTFFLLPLLCTSCISFQEGEVPEHLTGEVQKPSGMTPEKAQSAFVNDLLMHLVRTGKTSCRIACGKGKLSASLRKNLELSGMVVFTQKENAEFFLNTFSEEKYREMNLISRSGEIFWEKKIHLE